jgi:hypothetical protein
MARVFSEAAWKSDKIFNIQPVEWRAEYSWIYSIALADGTFEASHRLVWSAAYATVRPDWDIDKVGKLLDELERVGLLQRTAADDGKVWGRWVGSEKFLPTKERCASHRFKTGRVDLFDIDNSAEASWRKTRRADASRANGKMNGAAPEQLHDSTTPAPEQQRSSAVLGVGVGVGYGGGEGEGKGTGVGSDAAKSSENEAQPNNKSLSVDVLSSLTPGTPQNRRQRPVLSRDEYSAKKDELAIAEFAAELAGREPCPGCSVKHLPPFCKKPEEKKP